MSILILGSENDPTIQHFARHIHKTQPQCSILFLNQDVLEDKISFTKHDFVYENHRIPYHSIKAVWNRFCCVPTHSLPQQPGLYQWIWYLLDEVFNYVINRPKYSVQNHAKFAQLASLPLHHLHLPSTLLTNHAFQYAKDLLPPEQWIFKSASSHRSIVHTLNHRTPISTASQSTLTEPVILQTCIQGTPLRVHVLGSTCHVMQMSSPSIDYRYDANTQLNTITLPNAILNECVALCKAQSLLFAGIDLIYHCPHYYILEINTCPGYNYFDPLHKVSHTLLHMLTSAKV